MFFITIVLGERLGWIEELGPTRLDGTKDGEEGVDNNRCGSG
jgi:hypothetical protein